MHESQQAHKEWVTWHKELVTWHTRLPAEQLQQPQVVVVELLVALMR